MIDSNRFSRRKFLLHSAALVSVASAGTALAGCAVPTPGGAPSASSSQSAAEVVTPCVSS